MVILSLSMIISVITVLLIGNTQAALVINTGDEQDSSSLRIFKSVPLFYGQTAEYDNYGNKSISGPLIYHKNTSNLTDLSGFIVLFDDNDHFFYEKNFRVFQKKGALGVVTAYSVSRVPGQIMYLLDGSGYSDITLPIIQMFQPDYDIIHNLLNHSHNGLNATVTFSETNPWKALNESGYMLFFALLIGISSIVTILEASRRLFGIIYYSEEKVKITPITCLVLLIIASIIRIVFSVDPMRSFRIYRSDDSSVIISAPHFLVLLPTILLAFCLHDLVVSKKVKVNIFLGKLKIPFFITFIGVFVFGLVAMVIVGARISVSTLSNGLIIVTYVVNIALAIYFSYVSYKILSAMKTSSRYSKNLIRASIKLGFVIGGIILQTLIGVIVVFPILFSPFAYNTIFLIVFIFELIISAAIISFFESPNDKNSSSSSLSSRATHSESTVSRTGTGHKMVQESNNNNISNNNINKQQQQGQKEGQKEESELESVEEVGNSDSEQK